MGESRTGLDPSAPGPGRLVVLGIAALLSLPALGATPDAAPHEQEVSGPTCRGSGAPARSQILILRIPPEPKERRPDGRTALYRSGWVVFRDPVTGRFRKPASPEEAQELRRQIQAARPVPPPLHEVRVKGPAGGIGVRLDGRFHSALTVRKDATGRLDFECTDAASTPSNPEPSQEGR